MVVAFVGYVGGWTKAILGPGALAIGGILAACIATWFTFLPSFLFILAGGPLVERTHGELGFTAPLTAVTAAVVGVIVNLAVFFSWKVLWPMASDAAPFSGRFDVFSAVLSVAGIVALTRFKVGVIPLIAAFAAAGLAVRLLA
jgi:chromate transporter